MEVPGYDPRSVWLQSHALNNYTNPSIVYLKYDFLMRYINASVIVYQSRFTYKHDKEIILWIFMWLPEEIELNYKIIIKA